ncbi:MAG: alpha/beta hydrolase-fold protein [Melioribacteraceae bacterium]
MKNYIQKIFLTLFFCWAILPALQLKSQDKATDKTTPVTLHRSQVFNITSKINGVTYPIFVAIPGSYYTSNKTYPVVYMLDAYSSFGIMTQMARLLSFDKEIPEAIIVGISSEGGSKEFNYNRSRDFTPTQIQPEKLPEDLRSSIPVSGGAEKFLGFIKDELIPYVESNYRFSPGDRTLEGHSLGGLFVFYSLFREPGLFNRYIAISPALLWDDGLLLKQEEKFFRDHKSLASIIYTAVGSLESDFFKGPWKQLISNLKSRGYDGMKLRTEIAEGETHYTIIPYIVTHGLKSVFSEDVK